jgi:hypothetical protein
MLKETQSSPTTIVYALSASRTSCHGETTQEIKSCHRSGPGQDDPRTSYMMRRGPSNPQKNRRHFNSPRRKGQLDLAIYPQQWRCASLSWCGGPAAVLRHRRHFNSPRAGRSSTYRLQCGVLRSTAPSSPLQFATPEGARRRPS